MNTGEAH